MPVGEYCRRSPVTVAPDETIRAAAERLDSEGVGCLVVTDGIHPIGILTDRDVALEVLCRRLDPTVVRVEEIAVPAPVTIEEGAELSEAAEVIRRNGIHRLPVVDKQGRLVGLIAADDLIDLLVGELEGLADAIGKQFPRLYAEEGA